MTAADFTLYLTGFSYILRIMPTSGIRVSRNGVSETGGGGCKIAESVTYIGPSVTKQLAYISFDIAFVMFLSLFLICVLYVANY